MKIKRYDFIPGMAGDLQEFSGNGRYCLYEDVKNLIKRNVKLCNIKKEKEIRMVCAEIARGATAYTQFQTKAHYIFADVIAFQILNSKI